MLWMCWILLSRNKQNSALARGAGVRVIVKPYDYLKLLFDRIDKKSSECLLCQRPIFIGLLTRFNIPNQDPD